MVLLGAVGWAVGRVRRRGRKARELELARDTGKEVETEFEDDELEQVSVGEKPGSGEAQGGYVELREKQTMYEMEEEVALTSGKEKDAYTENLGINGGYGVSGDPNFDAESETRRSYEAGDDSTELCTRESGYSASYYKATSYGTTSGSGTGSRMWTGEAGYTASRFSVSVSDSGSGLGSGSDLIANSNITSPSAFAHNAESDNSSPITATSESAPMLPEISTSDSNSTLGSVWAPESQPASVSQSESGKTQHLTDGATPSSLGRVPFRLSLHIENNGLGINNE